MENDYSAVVEKIKSFVTPIEHGSVERDRDFNNKTDEEKTRDSLISDLLGHYVGAYKSKVTTQKLFRIILFCVSIAIIVAFTVIFIVVLAKFDFSADLKTTESLIGLISMCVTFLTSLIGVLKIIVKYCFPENDEKYITEIVKAVQQNDLENKKENLKHKIAMNDMYLKS